MASGNLTLRTIRHMLDRMRVSAADIDLGKTARIPYHLPTAPSDAVPVAIFDVDHTFWETFLGGGKGFVASGAPGGGPIRLARNPMTTSTSSRRRRASRGSSNLSAWRRVSSRPITVTPTTSIGSSRRCASS
ncbi:MAG: hypothetical protein R3B36_00505 [Polyangiaceae bacterium]